MRLAGLIDVNGEEIDNPMMEEVKVENTYANLFRMAGDYEWKEIESFMENMQVELEFPAVLLSVLTFVGLPYVCDRIKGAGSFLSRVRNHLLTIKPVNEVENFLAGFKF